MLSIFSIHTFPLTTCRHENPIFFSEATEKNNARMMMMTMVKGAEKKVHELTRNEETDHQMKSLPWSIEIFCVVL